MKTPKGFTLIELMIGLVVALLSALAISSTANMLQQQKRTSSGANHSLDNLNFIVNTLTSELRMAGHGMSFGGSFFCETIEGEAGFPAPVEIDNNGNNKAITIRYADAPVGIAKTTLKNSIAIGGALDPNSLNYNSGEIEMILTRDNNNACTTVSNSKVSSLSVPTGAQAVPITEYKSLTYRINNDNLVEIDNLTGESRELASDIVYMNVFGLVNGNWIDVTSNNYINDSLTNQYGVSAPSSLKIFIISREQSIGTSEQKQEERCKTADAIASSISIDTSGAEPILTINRDDLCQRYQSIAIVVPLLNLAFGAQSL